MRLKYQIEMRGDVGRWKRLGCAHNTRGEAENALLVYRTPDLRYRIRSYLAPRD